MESRPFLTNFLVERTSRCSNQFSTHYDEDLELNVVIKEIEDLNSSEGSIVQLSTMTKTFVESEKTDSDKDSVKSFLNNTDYEIFLATQTVTEVKNEKADRDAHDDHLIFLATQTFTKTTGEKPDSDV